MTRVKICGITNLEDAEAAVRYGADAIGFVFAKSPRRVTASQAKAIVKAVGPWISTVGVFVNEKPRNVRRIAKTCGLSVIQLHGDESAREANHDFPGYKIIKTFHMDGNFNVKIGRAHV